MARSSRGGPCSLACTDVRVPLPVLLLLLVLAFRSVFFPVLLTADADHAVAAPPNLRKQTEVVVAGIETARVQPLPPQAPNVRQAEPPVESRDAAGDSSSDPDPEISDPVWVFCAPQWQECECPGKIRWGSKDRWLEIPPPPGKDTAKTKCSIEKLEDIAPGDDGKHCECGLRPGSTVFKNINPALVPPGMQASLRSHLIASCDIFEKDASDGQWGASHWEAASLLCDPDSHDPYDKGPKALDNAAIKRLVQAWVDPRFEEIYQRVFGEDGWAEESFLNHFAGTPDSRFTKETEELIRSVHLFSTRPIVVVSFGMVVPPQWTPEKFPRLILIHAAPFAPEPFRSFHFNKLRAMLFVRIKVGVQLDSDQFVAPGIDAMFARTREEITKDYPRPILPVHFLDRNPLDSISIGNRVKYWFRFCPGGGRDCQRQSTRWGHAHPTWTYWALPFLGKWLRTNLRDETLPALQNVGALRVTDVPEDEDLLNVATWEEGGTKQWCKFDVPGPSDFEGWLNGDTSKQITGDTKYHPNGAPIVFYTAHGATRPDESKVYIDRIEKQYKAGKLPPPILFQGKAYRDGAELRRDHPDITCLI